MKERRHKARTPKRVPFQVSKAYLRAVERLESLPQNRSGADKSWVERAIRSWREHYANAVRVR